MRIAVISLGRRHAWALFGKELAEALSERVSVSYIGSQEADFIPEICESLLVHTGKNLWENFFYFLNPLSKIRILRFLKRQNPDLIIIPARHPWLLCLLPLVRTKKLLIIHDAMRHRGEQSALNDIIDRVLIRYSDVLCALSAYTQALLEKRHPKKQSLFLFHPVFRRYQSIEGMPPPEKIPRKYLLFLGRFFAYKGLDLLIGAWKKLLPLFPDLHLVIAGTGPEKPAKADRVFVIDRRLLDEEVAYLIDNACCVVLPYTDASQSGVIPVAFARGKAVVSTKVGGLAEQVLHGKTGFLCNPDQEELSLTVRKFLELSDEEKRDLALGISERCQKWSWEQFVERLLSLL